jgi:tripartite-type tricarboxylate transporter receptor subunit TctC
MFKRPSLPALCAALLVAATGTANAQAWPTKPIRIVVPYAAGGPADVIARLVAKKAGDTLGQTVIVDNKGGAGGTIGVDAALKSAPDGYTFALTAQGPLAGMPNLMKAPYAIADIQYLTLVARGPAVVAVAKKVPADTLADFVKLAKSQSGKLNYGSAGPGTTPHIAGELLKDEAGIEMTHVPYKGAGPAVTGLLGGEIDVAVVDLLNVLPHVAAGNLKVLAVASPSRAPQLPNVPTTKEAGLPNLVMDTSYGVIGPAGIPADVLNKFRDAIVAAVQSPDLKEQMVKLGVVPLTTTAQDYKAAVQAESDKWKRVISTAKITLE